MILEKEIPLELPKSKMQRCNNPVVRMYRRYISEITEKRLADWPKVSMPNGNGDDETIYTRRTLLDELRNGTPLGRVLYGVLREVYLDIHFYSNKRAEMK